MLKTLQECNELCHEIWTGSLEFASSSWDENVNTIKKQIDFWTSIDEDFKEHIDCILKKMPLETVKKAYEEKTIVHTSIEKLVEANDDYMSFLTTISNIIVKEQLRTMKKNTQKGFSMFGEYLNSFSGLNNNG